MFGLLSGLISKAVGFSVDGIMSVASSVGGAVSNYFSKDAREARREKKERREEAKRLRKERQEAEMSPTAANAAARFQNGEEDDSGTPGEYTDSNKFQD